MHIAPNHKARQDTAPGLVDAGTTIAANPSGTGPLAFDPDATGTVTGTVPLVVDGDTPTVTLSPTTTPTLTPSTTAAPETGAQAAGAAKSELPLGVVIGICVGAFIGVVLIICLFYAWYKRSSDKMSSAARRNAAGQAEQQRAYAKSFNRLSDMEKPSGPAAPPPVHSAHDHDADEKNFSMFKKSPSLRTTKTTTDEENAYDLPQLEFTKYRPTLAEELALENPEKPFAAAAAVARQNSGISWDGDTVADDSFLSMRSVRVESGTMSPTMVMAKMTPPATGSALHRWESAEVFNTEEQTAEIAHASASRNPFAEMVEERRVRPNNPFFNAQDAVRESRAMRSRSNSRASRTSRAQSMVRGEGRSAQTQSIAIPNMNPFIDMPATTVEPSPSDTMPPHAGLPHKPSISGGSAGSFGSERAMASLIAALELSKEEVEQRLRVVSMQGSTMSSYSELDDAVTVGEFPLPPGATAQHSP